MLSLFLILSAVSHAAEPAPRELYPPQSQAQPPAALVRCLTKIHVSYFDYDDKPQSGDLVVNKDVASDLVKIFAVIHDTHFPIKSVNTIDRYGWNDEASMAADNTSAYNYRVVEGSNTLSQHAFGRAIDVNPACNPYVQNGVADPPGTKHDPSRPCAVDGKRGAAVMKAFRDLGWFWGGNWHDMQDYQHFQKVAPPGQPGYCR